MKVSILVFLIVAPMLATIGLYSYAFASRTWSYIDEDYLQKHTANKEREYLDQTTKKGNMVQLEIKDNIRHAFRSYYSLFGYCLDYRWIPLLIAKSQRTSETESTPFCTVCNRSMLKCPKTGCCMKSCDNIPDCPSYVDEKGCSRPYNQTRYYWPEGNCMWQSTWIGDLEIPYFSENYDDSPRDFHYFTKRLRFYVMFLLFLAAPIFTLLSLLIIICINCVERFYSIPFAFVSFFSFGAFLSGAGALGLFLYEWVQDRLHRPDFTFELDETEALILAFNPWLIHVERLGLAFWLTVAAIGTSLFTTILSFCFCCGLQSEKSKLRLHVGQDTYEIMHMASYDD